MAKKLTDPPSELEVAEAFKGVRDEARGVGLFILRRLATHRNALEAENAELRALLREAFEKRHHPELWPESWAQIEHEAAALKEENNG